MRDGGAHRGEVGPAAGRKFPPADLVFKMAGPFRLDQCGGGSLDRLFSLLLSFPFPAADLPMMVVVFSGADFDLGEDIG